MEFILGSYIQEPWIQVHFLADLELVRTGQSNIDTFDLIRFFTPCNSTGKSYICNTQQKVKKRIKGHLGDACNLANKNQQSDSFAWHFVTVAEAENRDKLTRKDVRE